MTTRLTVKMNKTLNTVTGRMNDHYRFRAECKLDVIQFITKLHDFESIKITRKGIDCIVDVEIQNTCVDKIQAIMSNIPDSHTMIETLNRAHLYDGKRRPEPC